MNISHKILKYKEISKKTSKEKKTKREETRKIQPNLKLIYQVEKINRAEETLF